MEYETIKKLMDDMGNSKLTAIDIDFPDGMKISMKKEINKNVEKVIVKENSIQTNDNVQYVEENLDNSNEKEISKKDVDENCHIVTSPMVGTFYIKPDPNSAPYVEVGKKVNKGTILCIIEAMKLMNEIESEFDGEIVEILVKDGEIVEYGKPIFKIK